jgi:hypothetical protein
MIDYDVLPTHLQEGMRRYIEHGIETGGFLRAVLENDLAQASSRADPHAERALDRIFAFVREQVPPAAWGSPANVQAWIDRHKQARAAGDPAL